VGSIVGVTVVPGGAEVGITVGSLGGVIGTDVVIEAKVGRWTSSVGRFVLSGTLFLVGSRVSSVVGEKVRSTVGIGIWVFGTKDPGVNEGILVSG
jgi:hypothetical protein